MILTIGMIIKNEEKYLRRCLEALTPILEQVDSELIIADTGSTDNSVSIAKEFTENVFHFDWCNDFAAARNATLKKASGEWFMAVDADEIFKDTSSLIHFFNSGEYKDYNSASIIKRNYNDKARKISSDFNAPRLTKILKDTMYVDAIHERLTTYGNPLKILPIVADHYGYITDLDDDFVKRKSDRNLNLLFAQLKENSKDYFCLYNICKTYLFAGDTEVALKYCDEALYYAKEDGNFIQNSLYYHKSMILHMLGDEAGLLQTVADYFETREGSQDIIATDIEMYFLQAEYSFHAEDYRTSTASFKKYVKLCGEYRQGAYRTLDTMQHSIRFVDDEAYEYGMSMLIESSRCLCGYEEAVNEMKSLFTLLSNSQPDLPLPALYENTDIQYRGLFENILEKLMENGDCKISVLKEFADFGFNETPYAQLLVLRYRYETGSLTCQAIRNFFEDTDSFSPLYADAVFYALVNNISPDEIAAKVRAYDLGNFLFFSPFLHYEELCETAVRYSSKAASCSPEGKRWLATLYHWVIYSDKLSRAQSTEMIEKYRKAIIG